MGYHAKPNKKNYISGYYSLINESKYVSNPNQIVYRSSLELKFCTFIDKNPRVLKWGSEIIGVPYIGSDNKQHTYWIDFYLEILNENNPAIFDRVLVEVKPEIETMRIIKNLPPEKPKKITPSTVKSWKYAINQFTINRLKWVQAEEYARQRGMKFIVVTERTINQFYI